LLPIENSFYARQANGGKNNVFLSGGRVQLFYTLVRKNAPSPAAQNFVTKNSLLDAVHSEDFVIALFELQGVTDRQTGRQVDG